MARDIPRAALDRYNALVRGVSDAATNAYFGQIAASRPATIRALRTELATTLKAADSAASEIDRQFYQDARKYVTGRGISLDRSAAHSWDEAYLDRTLQAMVSEYGDYDLETGEYSIVDVDAFMADLAQFIGRMVNDGSKRRMADYGDGDPEKPKFARVPSGKETCAWCLMLASRGFAYTSREAASHSHRGCDCVIVPSWGGSGAQGYDPSHYYNMYSSARRDLETGNIPDELKERIDTLAAGPGYYKRDENGILAVMRYKYGLH